MHVDNILVVDDVTDNREIVCRHLGRLFVEVTEAESGDRALNIIESQKVDLLVLDIMMPGIDGLEVLRRVRQQYSASEMPVIMVTARNSPEDITRALELGANDYLTKPIVGTVLRARVNSQLERLRSARQLSQKVAELSAINEQLERETLARKKSEEATHYNAYHDQLTGLGNWNYLEDRLQRHLRMAKIAEEHVLALVVDIQNFNLINEEFGHSCGDSVLIDLTRRLKNCAGDDSIIARIGSNRFFVAMRGYATTQSAALRGENIARQLLSEVKEGSLCPEYSLLFGLAISPNDGQDTHKIIEAAEFALANCRADKNTQLTFYNSDTDKNIKVKRHQKEKLRLAVQNNELEIHYQPIVSAHSLKMVGHEALVRWKRDELSWVPPAELITMAEEDDLIFDMGSQIMKKALSASHTYFPGNKIAVNVSPLQFAKPEFVESVNDIIRVNQIDPSLIELELTETILIENHDDPVSKLHQLKALGVRVCLDDFGTGYSSLSYLSEFPVDKIKIDKCFVEGLFDDKSTLEIISAIINLGKRLNTIVTVEGVETNEQLDWLTKAGCDEIQGFLISKPLSLEDAISNFPFQAVA